jgi:hypothetical protein
MFVVIFNLVIFHSDVWGTVSDWVMIIVTLVTIYFVYRTLRSQLELQKVQMKLYKMEQIRLAEDLRPMFEYSLSNSETNKEKTLIHVFIRIANIGKKTARNMLITETEASRASAFFGLEGDDKYPEGMRPGAHHRALEPGFRKIINFILGYEGKKFPDKVVEFVVYYEDSMKNKYWDWVRCIPLNNEIIIKTYKGEPEMFDSITNI